MHLVGFNGQIPHSVIVWQINGENHSKTICYSPTEEVQALERLHTAGDFYNKYDKALIVRDNNETIECQNKFLRQRGA